MKYLEEIDGYILESGKSFYAHDGIVGISATFEFGGGFPITEGYDGILYDSFTKEERKEIAKYMSNLWKAWGSL